MPRSRNILFITHSNNDLDHFLPLFVEFKKLSIHNLMCLQRFIGYVLKSKLSIGSEKE